MVRRSQQKRLPGSSERSDRKNAHQFGPSDEPRLGTENQDACRLSISHHLRLELALCSVHPCPSFLPGQAFATSQIRAVWRRSRVRYILCTGLPRKDTYSAGCHVQELTFAFLRHNIISQGLHLSQDASEFVAEPLRTSGEIGVRCRRLL